MNLAPAILLVFIVSVHTESGASEVPKQAPDQQTFKQELIEVSCTTVGFAYVRTHVIPRGEKAGAGQSILGGLILTLLEPVHALSVLSRELNVRVTGGKVLNCAVTDRALSIVTTHAPVPEQSPLQPMKFEPVDGAALRETSVPFA
jgi:hypothetical protein